ncbi:MAG: UDP-N-acetylmuramate dehydrogenase [Porticoccaceae bacterium]
MNEPQIPEIVEQADLQALNSLAVAAQAEFFCSVTTTEQLIQALNFANERQLPVTALGGGSNLVLAGDISGLVIYLDLMGISHQQLTSEQVHVSFAAGENWHSAVEYCLQQGWYGLENLSLIPGNVGAAPIQNIGAYGVELSDVFVRLEAIDTRSGLAVTMDSQACQFGYRDSIFKRSDRNHYLITEVTLALSTVAEVNIEYPALASALEGTDPTPASVSDAVCRIRRSKLPDPAVTPNVGSFFKNPIVDKQHLEQLTKDYSALPFYNQQAGDVKIPAAWLIDQCGYLGARVGDVGVHEKHALVLVNFGGSGAEILQLAAEIQAAVKARFDIALEIEPRIYGSPR